MKVTSFTISDPQKQHGNTETEVRCNIKCSVKLGWNKSNIIECVWRESKMALEVSGRPSTSISNENIGRVKALYSKKIVDIVSNL